MLSVQNLKVSIGEVQILKGIDMKVPSGELHAIMGPNGSGKSTFCHALMGNPDYEQSGTIAVWIISASPISIIFTLMLSFSIFSIPGWPSRCDSKGICQ